MKSRMIEVTAPPQFVVQFPHPQDEHNPRNVSRQSWNTGDHARKFLQSDGRYMAEDGSISQSATALSCSGENGRPLPTSFRVGDRRIPSRAFSMCPYGNIPGHGDAGRTPTLGYSATRSGIATAANLRRNEIPPPFRSSHPGRWSCSAQPLAVSSFSTRSSW